jgi:alpha-L-fucosidase
MYPSRLGIALGVSLSALACFQATSRAAELARPSDVQYAWHEQERIQFVCLDPCTWQGREYDNHTTALADMRLERLDVEQWCAAAASWGARELLLVCKHTGGFCWWPTTTTDYSVKGIPWQGGKGNLVQDLAAACRRHGLALGVYLYPDDPRYAGGIGRSGKTDDPAKQEEWNRLYRTQWEEVLTLGGKDLLREIWFDGGCQIPLGDLFERLAPNAVLFGVDHPSRMIRWVGNEAGIASEANWNAIGGPDGTVWAPMECDTPLYDHNWFWAAANESKRKSLDHLLSLYVQSVGRGSVLLLNSTPNTDGLIPEGDMERYREFGQAIERTFGQALGAVTEVTGSVAEIDLRTPQRLNCSDLWEDYRLGHRIRAYVVEGRVNGAWTQLATGTAVGRRKIDMFAPVLADQVRVRVTQSAGEAVVRRFQVHHVDEALASAHLPPVSRGCPATASSVHSAPYEARFLVDGDSNTRWGTADGAREPWVEIDLGRPRKIARATASELADRVRQFRIEVRLSPAEPWRSVLAGERIGARWAADFERVTARFVRLQILAYEGPGATLWEFEVHDRAAAWEAVGTWAGAAVDVDLSTTVNEPGQYELQFADGAGNPVVVESAELLLDGQPTAAADLDGVGSATLRLRRTQAIEPASRTAVRAHLRVGADARGAACLRPLW